MAKPYLILTHPNPFRVEGYVKDNKYCCFYWKPTGLAFLIAH